MIQKLVLLDEIMVSFMHPQYFSILLIFLNALCLQCLEINNNRIAPSVMTFRAEWRPVGLCIQMELIKDERRGCRFLLYSTMFLRQSNREQHHRSVLPQINNYKTFPPHKSAHRKDKSQMRVLQYLSCFS